jgi:signal transduction histidine kinase
VSTDIAHDLRTPLTHVRQKLEQLKGGADERVAAAALEMEADVDDLLRQFDAMLRLAEIENDVGAAARTPVDLAELTLRIADAYRPDVEASGRRLAVDCRVATAEGEADLIALAITNLVENALRHTPAGAFVRIGTDTVDGRAVVSVVDDGPGIAEDQREAALQRFHRLEASRTTQGFGLGLAIVAAVAKRQGAALELGDAGPGLSAVLRFDKKFSADLLMPT